MILAPRSRGEKSAAAVLARYEHLDAIPASASDWAVKVRGAERLSATLAERRDEALLYRRLATLREDVPLAHSLAALEWRGARPELRDFCARIGFSDFPARVHSWR